ncbi:oxidoreductase [Luteimicrobium subarcticum]|uniref:Ferredoxin-NADP reductase n=1 Tax=Luteimicrobium subarcticum TaxID=620910 RepID=A0A2M8WT08_9MICO|nr:oxidoreductase [Luteimicrobium subarcticum]PJI94092.1 ferredoxin-NADP reductase [Luteimicrobium subarcticum]
MTETALRLGARVGPLPGWQLATLVDAWDESPSARTLVLEVPTWPGHLAGQHLDVRLTAEDGYRAERSYSIGAGAGAGIATVVEGSGSSRAGYHPAPRSSAPPASPATPARDDPDPALSTDVPRVEITVQRVPGGEVSGYLTDPVEGFRVGYPVEVRGPVGGWFVWDPDDTDPMVAGRPVLLVAGGSGVVPLMAMVRARRAARSRVPFRLVYSVRTPDDRLYVDELTRPRAGDQGLDITVVHTRAAPLDARRGPGRLTPAELAAHGWPADLEPVCYVCGPTPFVEVVARMLLLQGHAPERIRTERFGPAGD